MSTKYQYNDTCKDYFILIHLESEECVDLVYQSYVLILDFESS